MAIVKQLFLTSTNIVTQDVGGWWGRQKPILHSAAAAIEVERVLVMINFEEQTAD